jgi:eukaryotic-like serine/threonine-protein kinase
MSADIRTGQVIKGKYVIDRVVGEGGMGVVVAARHVTLDQRFAIKFLRPAMLVHKEITERFVREARAASRLESDHVARVIDVDTLADGALFMVMEYLEGSDLSTVRREKRPLAADVAVRYLLEACEALVEAHATGIVHRDLKPANLFLARRLGGKTRVKVLDFGISKMNDPGEASVTRTSMVMGSAEYMSPEQMLSTRDVDARSDIWALGVTLYELLTAQVPFPGESITQVCALVMSRSPAPPSTHRLDLPKGLDTVVLRCLEKERDRRYANVNELIEALTPFARPELVTPMDRVSDPSGASAGGTAVLGASGAGFAPTTGTKHSGTDAALAPRPVSVAIVASATGIGTMAAVSSAPGGPPTSSRAPLLIGVVAVAAIALATLTFALRSGGPAAATASASAASSPPVEVLSAAQPIVIPAPPEVSAAPVEVSAAPVDQAPSAIASVAQPRLAPARRVTPAIAAPPSPRPSPKVNCNPPFTVDSSGVKHAKPDCT